MTVLPTMREREPRRIGKTAWDAVNDFGDQRAPLPCGRRPAITGFQKA
jgi:hypothetical protein